MAALISADQTWVLFTVLVVIAFVGVLVGFFNPGISY